MIKNFKKTMANDIHVCHKLEKIKFEEETVTSQEKY